MPIEDGVAESQPIQTGETKDEMEVAPEEQASRMLAAFSTRAEEKKGHDGEVEKTTPSNRGRFKGTGKKAGAKKNKNNKDDSKKNQAKKNDRKKGSVKKSSAKKKDTKKITTKGIEVHDRDYWRNMGKEARKVHHPWLLQMQMVARVLPIMFWLIVWPPIKKLMEELTIQMTFCTIYRVV